MLNFLRDLQSHQPRNMTQKKINLDVKGSKLLRACYAKQKKKLEEALKQQARSQKPSAKKDNQSKRMTKAQKKQAKKKEQQVHFAPQDF